MNTYPMNPLMVGQANFSPYYNPMITNPVIPNYQPITAPSQSRHIDCVNGKESAYAFQLGPNSSVILADNLQPKIWVVTTDASGYKAVKGYKIIEDEDDSTAINVSGTVTDSTTESESKWKQDVENLSNRLDVLEEKLNEYGKSNNKSVNQSQSYSGGSQSNDRNGQSSKGSNGNNQSNGSK